MHGTASRMGLSMRRVSHLLRGDWISTGRRPAGLCGAAILISARYHGFKRTTHQIVKVVKVCHETIRKRLQEFKNTSVAQLTMEEFEAIEDDHLKETNNNGMDPPAFIKNLLKKNKAMKSIENDDNKMSIAIDQIQQEISQEHPDINQAEELYDDGEKIEESKEIATQNNIIEVVPLERKRSKKARRKDLDENESDLSDISDGEINLYLLNEKEKVVKSVVWHEMNKEWLQEQKDKEKLRQKMEAKNKISNRLDKGKSRM